MLATVVTATGCLDNAIAARDVLDGTSGICCPLLIVTGMAMLLEKVKEIGKDSAVVMGVVELGLLTSDNPEDSSICGDGAPSLPTLSSSKV